MIQSRKDLTLGAFWAAFAILMWSGSLVLLRLGVTTHLNAYDLTAVRFGAAGVLLLPVVVKKGVALDRLGVVGLVLLIACFGALYITLISEALNATSASTAGALNPGVMAVSAVVFGVILFNDRTSFTHIAGIALILSGVLGQVAWASAGLTRGHLILGLTGIMWAIYAMILRKSGIAALHATALVAVGSALIYLPIYAFLLPKRFFEAPVSDVLIQTGFQGILVSIFAVYAFNRSNELLGAVIGSTLPALIPLATLLLGAIILNEPYQAKELVIAFLIGVGVALVLVRRQPVATLPRKAMSEPR